MARQSLLDVIIKQFGVLLHLLDWTILLVAIRACPNQSMQLTKRCLELLPTATRVHGYDKQNSPYCPHCLAHPESIDHLLECPVLDCMTWTTSNTMFHQLITVSTSCSDHHHDIILDIFVSGIEQWMSDSCLSTESYPLVFHDLIQSRMSIGWNQIICDCVSILWAKHIDEALVFKSISHPSSSGHLCVKSMSLKFWERFFVSCEEHNATVHRANSSEQNK
jgi:hypothetical protein